MECHVMPWHNMPYCVLPCRGSISTLGHCHTTEMLHCAVELVARCHEWHTHALLTGIVEKQQRTG